jgi:hypothetical protein
VDVLMDIRQQRRKGRPYVIVFCGVNGVGKSTNLAKITYWLGQHGIKVSRQGEEEGCAAPGECWHLATCLASPGKRAAAGSAHSGGSPSHPWHRLQVACRHVQLLAMPLGHAV